MIVLSQDQKTLTDCESVTVNKNGEGEGFILNAKTANNEIVIGHFSTEQEAKDAVYDLFLGTQLGISVTVPCQKERDEEAEEHERMIKHLKEIIFSDTEGLDDEDEFEPEDKKSSGKPSRGKKGGEKTLMWIKSQDGTRMTDCVSLSVEKTRNSGFAIIGHVKGSSDKYILGNQAGILGHSMTEMKA